MRMPSLTTPAGAAHGASMAGKYRAVSGILAVLGSTLAGGCISVDAPDKPIVIELNINIKQEVIYRLASDVEQNIDANPEIF